MDRPGETQVLLRQLTGDVLRQRRLAQGLTMREVSALARVSLGYISEVERGHKEASSELLSALCSALGVPLSQVLRDVATLLEVDETAAVAGSVVAAGVVGDTAGGAADREPVYAA